MPVTISVVTPILNRRAHIMRALASVRAQKISDIEIVAVDGGSTDGTREALAIEPDVRLIDAPGSSIYQALNIGVRAAKGALIVHLNSDDELFPEALRAISTQADQEPEAEIYRGLARYIRIDADGHTASLRRIDSSVALKLDVKSVLFGVPAINACIIRRSAYDRLGLYDERYSIAADREWLLRALAARARVSLIDAPLYLYAVHGGSLTMAARHNSESRYAVEHLRIVADWLGRTEDRTLRAALYSWHARETARFLLKAQPGPQSLRELGRAFRLSPIWPLLSIPPLLEVAARRFELSRFE